MHRNNRKGAELKWKSREKEDILDTVIGHGGQEIPNLGQLQKKLNPK